MFFFQFTGSLTNSPATTRLCFPYIDYIHRTLQTLIAVICLYGCHKLLLSFAGFLELYRSGVDVNVCILLIPLQIPPFKNDNAGD